MSSTQHIAEAGQSIWDVALQRYGTLDGVAYLLADNNWSNGFDHQLAAGEVVALRSIEALSDTSKSTVLQLEKTGRIFNTGVPYTVSDGNEWVEGGWVESGWVSTAEDATPLDLVEYYNEVLQQLGLDDDYLERYGSGLALQYDVITANSSVI